MSLITNKGIFVKCPTCGKLFRTTQERVKLGRGKHCSKRCLYEDRKKLKTFVCINCGKSKTLTSRQYGNRKGMFCSQKCTGEYRSMDNHPMWSGGERQNDNGYILQLVETQSYQRQHRIIMERSIGRKLLSYEVVHHINGNKADNRLSNLKLMTSKEHKSYHATLMWKERKSHGECK